VLIFCGFISENKYITKKNNEMIVLVLKIRLFVIKCGAISQDMTVTAR